MKASRPIALSKNGQRPWALPALLVAGVGLALAAACVRNRTRRAERAWPPNGRFVEVDGVRLHCVERGSGTPLVLLHGMSTMGLDFLMSKLVDRAARRYRVIVFDRPGYGHSERPRNGTVWGPEVQARLIAGALRQMGVAPAIVLGDSWASQVAVALALDHPASVRSIVLEAGYYYPTVRPDMLLMAPPAIPLLGDLYRHTVAPLLFRALWPLLVKRMFAPQRVPGHFWGFPAWMAVRPSQLRTTAAESVEVVLGAMRLQRRYRDLAVPVVIVVGSGDRLVDPRAHSERLHHELPGTDFRRVPGAGHMLHHIAPDDVMAAIDAAAQRAAHMARTARQHGVAAAAH